MPIAPEYLHLIYPGEEFPAYLYGRNSHDPTKKGRSVGDQLHEGQDLCDRHSWPVVGVFDKDVDRSASRHAKKARDDFEAMLEGIAAKKCRIVVAWEASRYYRDLEVYVRLRRVCMEAGVLLCYNGVVYDLSKSEDRRATAQDALQAENEAEAIRDRNLRTQRRLAEKGRPAGRTPYGYVRRYDPSTGDLIDQVPHPARSRYVVAMFERCAAGSTLYSIAAWLNTEPEARQTSGRPWSHDKLTIQLRNRAYIGRRVHQGKDIGEALWEPIVPEELFYEVQRILDRPSRRTQRDSRVRHLLSFMALCGECDKAPPHVSYRTPGSQPVIVPELEARAADYDDPRCVTVHRLYIAGYRPTILQVVTAVGEAHDPISDAEAERLRGEVEQREPDFARFRPIPPPILKRMKSNGKSSYLCTARMDTGIRADELEAYVVEGVLEWLRSDAAAKAFERDHDDADMEAARVQLLRLQAQLDEARELAGEFGPDGAPKLSVASLAALESRLLPLIEDAQAKVEVTTSAGMSPLLRSLAGRPDAVARWDALELPQQRALLREIVTVRLHRAFVGGAPRIGPERIRLSFVGQPGFLSG
ncbi:recombinase family protein [Streptomyces sp. NPDC088732]|uniref:recombinase family protein n=1 Tax=Streptomyces sp. NPDC088732 TaxID=3365879 RepID=UPI00381EA79C